LHNGGAGLTSILMGLATATFLQEHHGDEVAVEMEARPSGRIPLTELREWATTRALRRVWLWSDATRTDPAVIEIKGVAAIGG
jgi:hypothetical protein